MLCTFAKLLRPSRTTTHFRNVLYAKSKNFTVHQFKLLATSSSSAVTTIPLQVQQFGSLKVVSTVPTKLNIIALDPQSYPLQDRCIISGIDFSTRDHQKPALDLHDVFQRANQTLETYPKLGAAVDDNDKLAIKTIDASSALDVTSTKSTSSKLIKWQFSVHDQADLKSSSILVMCHKPSSQTEGNDHSIELTEDMNYNECNIFLPIKYDIDVQTISGDITLANFENQSVNIKLIHGKTLLDNLKTFKLNVDIRKGSLLCTTVLQADSDICVDNGNVACEKVLGTKLRVKSDSASMNFQSLYAENSEFETRKGDIDVGSCHRNCEIKVREKGDVTIGTVDGSLKAIIQEGNFAAHISKHEEININIERGDVTVKVPDNLHSKVSLEGSDVFIEDEVDSSQLQTMEDGYQTVIVGQISNSDYPISKTLKAKTQQGCVNLGVQDWIETLHITQNIE